MYLKSMSFGSERHVDASVSETCCVCANDASPSLFSDYIFPRVAYCLESIFSRCFLPVILQRIKPGYHRSEIMMMTMLDNASLQGNDVLRMKNNGTLVISSTLA